MKSRTLSGQKMVVERMVDRSQVSRGGALVMGCAIAFFLGMTVLSLYGWSKGFPPRPMELCTELLLTLVLAGRAAGQYVYELNARELCITCSMVPGFTRHHRIPCEQIIGLYQYAPQLVSALSFRHTRRLQSALDSRPVWTVAYTAPGKNNQPDYCRVYVKMRPEMLTALKGRLNQAMPDTEEALATRQMVMEK